MSTKNLGRVFMVPKGQWDKTLNYTKLDLVTNKVGKISYGYIATTNIPANTEITDSRWMNLYEVIDGDVTEDYKNLQKDVNDKAIMVDTIYSKLQSLCGVEITSTTPVNEQTGLWINPSSNETVNLPEINDDETNEVDTWSSQKIYNEIAPLKKSLEDGIQSDWNQNDDTAVNYVKNRPFYTYYVEATFNYNPDENDNILEGFVPFKEGDNVTVKIDGIEYSKRACSIQDGGGTTMVYIGDDPSNQDSFNWCIGCFYISLEDTRIVFVSEEPHSITYKKEQFHTIDPRYIPVSTRILQTDEDVFGSSITPGTRIASTRANPYPNKKTLTELSVETFNKMLDESIAVPDYITVEGNIAHVSVHSDDIVVRWSYVGFYYQNKVGLAGAHHQFCEAVICEDDTNPGTIISKCGFVIISDKALS